jgi:3-oxoacyl-[acyl-carrier-protein] synthase-3
VCIRGTGSHLPDRVVDNRTLAGMVRGYDPARSGPFEDWVEQVTHIHERRVAEPHVRSSDLALVAARRALEAANVRPEELGLVVYASFTPSQLLPGDHCLFAERLGVRGAGVFHMMAACAGSAYGIGVAYGMITAGVYDHVLVVGTETITRVVNWHDPVTAILFGDGAGAVVVSRCDPGEGKGMLPPDLTMEFNARSIHMGNSNVPLEQVVFPDRLQQPGVPLVEQAFIEMEGGPTVLRRAVQNMVASCVRCLGYDPQDLRRDDPDLRRTLDSAWIIPHQANGRILDGMVDKLKVPPERVIRTIYEYGNISAASNLIALDHAVRIGNTARRLDADGKVIGVEKQPQHRIRPGDLVLLPSIGGGFLVGCVGFRM